MKIMTRHLRPSKNLLHTLEAVQAKHEQILISNTIPEGMRLFIHLLGISKFFNETNAFPVDQHMSQVRGVKKDILAGYLEVRPKYDEIVVIGDSETDMELAEAFGAKAYLYAHQGMDFRSKKGHYKINDLKEVLREL
jgi:FMN phosphatase YigB (HAD superfamily)